MTHHLAIIAAAAGLAAAALPFAAAAQDETTLGEVTVEAQPYDSDVVVRHQVVRFADLDLNRVDDAAVLLRRIHTAAVNVCSPEERVPLDLAQPDRRCMARAMDDAVFQANSPVVDDLYHGREVASAY
ncbi:MAG TPA: UrcA family protein [Caulobacteraceae bacterium]|nr:UrcA family protein [Caulobacteraceae bacterium]